MADLKKNIGEHIRAIRKIKGLTQESLADRSGVSFSYISDVERGTRNISLVSLDKIMQALDIHASEIFNYEHYDRQSVMKEKHTLIEKIDHRLENRALSEVKFVHAVTKKFADIMEQ